MWRATSTATLISHSRIYKNLPNRELIDMINDLRHRWGITRSVFQIAPERMRESSAEHDGNYRAISPKRL